MTRVGLRTRMIIAIVAVLIMMITLVGAVTVTVTTTQAAAVQNRLLDDKISSARLLAQRNVAPRRIVEQLSEPGVRVLVIRGEETLAGTAAPDDWRTRQARLGGRGAAAGATVRVGVAPAAEDRLRRQVVLTVVVTGLVSIVVGAGLAVLAARVAAAPLDRMARTAGEIAAGARGRRLGAGRALPGRRGRSPTSRTELARTAEAFDAMLDELEGAEGRARAAEERMREFLGDAAHELRTPLAGIGAAGEAMATTEDAEVRRQLAALLVTESRRAGGIVTDLLDLARLDAGVTLRPEPVSLRAAAEDHRRRQAGSTPAVTVTVEGDDVVVPADPDRLARIIGNVVGNAVRAVGDAGTVIMTITGDSTTARLEVLDDGPGVEPADREVIFERMVRRRSDADGTGLGLPIARGLARAHGGDVVCLEPPVGHHGARFVITLPVQRSQPPSRSGRT